MNLTAVGGDWHNAVTQRSIDTFSEKMWDAYRANYENDLSFPPIGDKVHEPGEG